MIYASSDIKKGNTYDDNINDNIVYQSMYNNENKKRIILLIINIIYASSNDIKEGRSYGDK